MPKVAAAAPGGGGALGKKRARPLFEEAQLVDQTPAAAGEVHAARGDDAAPSSALAAEAGGDSDDGFDCPIPSDTLAALHLLRAQFPKLPGVPPFALTTQLYTVLQDRTVADRELDALRRANEVRLVTLPSEDCAVALASDYAAAVAACAAALEAGGGGGGSARALLPVFRWFTERVLPRCSDVVITHAELRSLLARPPASVRAEPPQPDVITDQHISMLLQHGCLTRHAGHLAARGGGGGARGAGGECYVFALPGAGAAVRSVEAGRQEILGALARRRHPELLEAALARRGLRRSVLGVRWHVREMVGAGSLLRIDTTVGPLLRAAKRR